MIKLGMNLMIDIPDKIQRETDYYSDDEIKDAIMMTFGLISEFNQSLAQELQIMITHRRVMDMLRSDSFQQQWTEKKILKCQTQLGISESYE